MWAEEIAVSAAENARPIGVCQWNHASQNKYGENLAYGGVDSDPTELFQVWVDERELPGNNWEQKGHFFVLTKKELTTVGCFYSTNCNTHGSRSILACRYGLPKGGGRIFI